MDQEPNVTGPGPDAIRRQIENTRSSLTDKLETLEAEVRQTVCNAKDAVVNTVETVKQKVEQTVDTVKHTFDLRAQVDDHPWAMVGGATAAGFVAGSLLPATDRMARRMSRQDTGLTPLAMGNGPAPPPPPFTHYTPPEPARSTAAATTEAVQGWLGDLAQRFHPEINQLKGLAIGAAMALVRDLIRQSSPPNLTPQLSNIVDSVTEKLGGRPIEGSVLRSGAANRTGW